MRLLVLLSICSILMTMETSVHATGLDKYLSNMDQKSEDILFIPVTIRDGIESNKSLAWPLKDPNSIFGYKFYGENKLKAAKAGLDLKSVLNEKYAIAFDGENFFFLFYNFVKAANCPRDYVIQKVKIEKSYYMKDGRKNKSKKQYLVEAIKLNSLKETKKADEHRKGYALKKSFKRKTVVEAEVGCGQVPGYFQGTGWPADPNKLYYRIQDYTNTPQLYNKVRFDFSRTYIFEFEFDKEGNYSYKLPE